MFFFFLVVFFFGVAIARRLAIAYRREICYRQTSGNSKYSGELLCQVSGNSKLFVNLLLPDVFFLFFLFFFFYKICAEIDEYVYRRCRKYACRS